MEISRKLGWQSEYELSPAPAISEGGARQRLGAGSIDRQCRFLRPDIVRDLCA
jgi:hypothetical protein